MPSAEPTVLKSSERRVGMRKEIAGVRWNADDYGSLRKATEMGSNVHSAREREK
jgi:hypothetical protein